MVDPTMTGVDPDTVAKAGKKNPEQLSLALLDAAVNAMGGQQRPGQHEMVRQVVR